MTLEEAILEEVRELPVAKQEEALRLVRGLRTPQKTRRVPMRDRSREMQWIQDNRKAYADKWVAIEGDRLIMADDDAMKVYEAAKAEGIEVPMVIHILPEDDLPFVGGW